jgi:hypothetical protein
MEISSPWGLRKNKPKQSQFSRSGTREGGFVGRFFSLAALFGAYLGIEFGLDNLVGPGGLYQPLRRDFDRAFHEFRDVIDNHAQLLICRVLLRQQKRLAEMAVSVKIAKIKMRRLPILTLAAENEPAAVAGEAVVTFRPVAVYVLRLMKLQCFGIEQIQVRIRHVKREIRIFRHAEKYIFAVRRELRMGDAQA